MEIAGLFLVSFEQEAQKPLEIWTKSPDSEGKIQIPAQLPGVNSGFIE